MTDMNRAGLLEIIAGKTRSNTAAAILSNTKDLEEAYKSAMEADGSALEENEKYLDSIQGRIDLFNNALQTFWNNLLESEAIKFFVNLGTQILELASAFGELRSIMFVFFTYLNLTKKIDLAKWIFGPQGLSAISKLFAEFTSMVKNSNKTKLLALPPPADTSSSAGGAPKTPSPSSPTSGYARLGAGTEPLDFDKIYGSKFSRMWQNHIIRLKDSINRVKQDFTDIWQHHNERVAQSVEYASGQFNKFKNTVGNIANSVKSAFDKMFARNKVATQPADVAPYGDASKQANKFSQIWQNHIVRLKDSISRVKNDLSTIWEHHNERVKWSIAYTSKQFNKLKVNASKVFGGISKVVQSVANGIKKVFAKISAPVVQIFNGIANKVKVAMNKIKATAGDTAKAFKSNLGYTDENMNAPAWLSARKSLTADDLTMPENIAEEIDKINQASVQGEAALNNLMLSYGNTNKALQAYIASLNGGKASIAGFKAFCDAQNISLKATGVSALIAKAGVTALQTTLSFGLSIVIQAVIELLGMLINHLKDLANPTEKLAEDISDLKSKISNTESEIDSINDSLETCRDRMAELIALPTLSFVEQEELSNLEKEVALLERQLTLKEALLKSQEAQYISDSKKYINTAWTDQGKYYVDSEGRIKDDSGWDGFWNNSLKTTKVLDKAMQEYQSREKRISDAENAFLNWDSMSWFEKNAAMAALEGDNDPTTIYNVGQFDDRLAEEKAIQIEIAKSIEAVFADPSYAGLSYGMSDDIDAFLDEFYTYQDKWNIILGTASKSDSIASLFDKTATTEMKNLGKQLQEIADDESLSIDQRNGKIKEIISSVDLESDAYRRLKTTMDTVGVTAQDIADYFTLETGIYDSDTIDGIMKQYTQASNVMKKLQDMGAGNTFTVDGTVYNWDEFFSKDDAGKFEARADKFAEILKGMDKNTRKTFMSLSEQVKNGSISWDDAIKSLNLSGLAEVSKIIEAQLSELNKNVFKGLDDELSGLIDSFSELSTVLEDVASSMDLLKTAEQQMNNSGRISVKTALELIESTDRWNEVLTIENGKITLNADAEEILIQAKLNTIKANIQEALSSARLQLAQLGTAKATLVSAEASDVTTEAYAIYTDAMNQYSASIAGFGAAIGELLDGDDDWNVLGAFKSAYDSALIVKDHEATVASEDLTQKIADLEAQAAILEGIDTPEEFANYYDYDKTPGDKDSDGSQERAADALEAIVDKFDRIIENLDNQQTYIQNEIDIKGANGEAVSRSYYEEMIALEGNKQTENINKRDAILAGIDNGTLTMTDEVVAALWEAEHAIQESTLRMVEFRQAITDLYVEAFDKLIEAFDNSDDFLSDQQNYIDKYQELMELQGGAITAGGIQEQIAIEEEKMADNITELDALRQALANGMTSGYIEEGSKEWVDLQDKIRAAEEAVLDNKIAIEQYRDELNQLAVDAFDLVRGAFSNKDNFLTSQQDYIQGYIDLLEAQGIDVPEEVYQALIDREEDRRDNFVADLKDARTGLNNIAKTLWDNAVESNPEMANWTDEQKQAWLFSQKEYVDAYNTIVETEGKIQDCDIATAEWEKTIRDMGFEKFDRFIGRLDDVKSEIDNVRGLFDDGDVANKDGTWTEEGITSLGLAYQQMELAQQKSQEYAEKINELNVAYQNGEMSEQEYYDRLKTLKDGQWSAIDAYEAAKDAIIDMEEARIDMIEEGLNEEIEAYQELIETKKEELDAERDLYDFKKKVKDQAKDIAALDRRIASLSGSTADADIAQLRKLQAERRELQEGLDDTFYQHSMDSQSKALGDDLASFTEIREDYLETLRDALDDTTAIITEKITEVLGNADTVMNTLNTTSGEYGVTLTSNLMAPWIAGAEQATAFKTTASGDVLSLINEEGIITLFGSEETKAKFTSVFDAGSTAANTFKTTVETNVSNIKSVVENSTSDLTSNLQFPWEDTTAEDGPIATFSSDVADAINDAVNLAKEKASSMFDWLSKPWKDMVAEDGPLNTFSDEVAGVYDGLIQEAQDYVTDVNTVYGGIKYPSYTGGGNGDDDDNGKQGRKKTTQKKLTTVKVSDPKIKALQQVLNTIFKSGLVDDGIWGSKTESALRTAQKTMRNVLNGNWIAVNGKYDSDTRSAMLSYINHLKNNARGMDTQVYNRAKNMLPVAFHAKGTMGTKRDEWAIDSEPWLGDELVLVPTAQGNLSYMRLGTGVVPADLTKELVDIAKIGVNGLMMPKLDSGVNLMSSYISKPELNVSFDALVKAEKITEETLPAVKRLVTEELNKFTKQLNYAIKRK